MLARNSLEVQRLSLDLAQRSLRENRARVEIGTMAPIDVVQAQFEKDGKEIAFRKVHLQALGQRARGDDVDAILMDGPPLGAGAKKAARIRKKSPGKVSAFIAGAVPGGGANSGRDPEMPSELPKLFEDLRTWRLQLARAQGVPAFRILSDRVLREICEARPQDEAALLQVPGLGPKLVQKYGADLIRAVQEN